MLMKDVKPYIEPSEAVRAAVTKTYKGECLWYVVPIEIKRLWWGIWRYTCGDAVGYGRDRPDAWERMKEDARFDRITSVYPVEFKYSGDIEHRKFKGQAS